MNICNMYIYWCRYKSFRNSPQYKLLCTCINFFFIYMYIYQNHNLTTNLINIWINNFKHFKFSNRIFIANGNTVLVQVCLQTETVSLNQYFVQTKCSISFLSLNEPLVSTSVEFINKRTKRRENKKKKDNWPLINSK